MRIPSSLLCRTFVTAATLWLVLRALLLVLPPLIAAPPVWLPAWRASLYVVLLAAVLVRVDIWRAKEALLWRNLGFDPWVGAALGGALAAALELVARWVAAGRV